MPFLPAEVEDGFEEAFPVFDDLFHGSDLVLRLLKVLINRKKSFRQQFDGIMKLVKQDIAKELRYSFRDCLLDYFERFLEVRANVERTSLVNMLVSSDMMSPNPASQVVQKELPDLCKNRSYPSTCTEKTCHLIGKNLPPRRRCLPPIRMHAFP